MKIDHMFVFKLQINYLFIHAPSLLTLNKKSSMTITFKTPSSEKTNKQVEM